VRARRATRRPKLAESGGFTLIETIVAAALLAVGLITLLGLLDTSVKASLATKQREQATNLARQVLEDARGIPYPQISPSSIVAQLQALPNLANEGGAAWQVMRGQTMYTIAVKECSIDDGKGENGKHEWGVHKNKAGENPFCKDPGEEEWKEGELGPDPAPEDLKRIAVDVTWTAKGRSPDVHLVETLSSAGAAPGLSATNLKLAEPEPDAGTKTEPIITKATTALLTFSVTSPEGTAAMRWSLEGVAQSNAPVHKEGTTWTFTWSIPDPGVSDGTYTVAVQAIDKVGALGPPVSIPVTLIRNVPAAPSGLKGGFNKVNKLGSLTKVVELEWTPNSERNIIGYRVYRPEGTLGTSKGLACPGSLGTLSTATHCIDFGPELPEYNASNLTYKVVPLYRNVKNEVTEGSVATLKLVAGSSASTPPPAPNAPTFLELSHNAEGAVVLNWKAPTGGEPVVFYRIYRGSTEYTSRYDVSPGTTYTDNDATESHSYWVTAVDANLTESGFLGPVTG
jgi:type II secretory pathway pseudopilin PulG